MANLLLPNGINLVSVTSFFLHAVTVPGNFARHLECAKEGCTFFSHRRFKNAYHRHRRECHERRERARETKGGLRTKICGSKKIC